MKLYYVPPYVEHLRVWNSQSNLFVKYLKLLSSKYEVEVVLPHDEEAEKVCGYTPNPNIEADSVQGVYSPSTIKYLRKVVKNEDIVFIQQPETAIDLAVALIKPPYKMPKLMYHYIVNEDYPMKDPRSVKRLGAYFTMPTITNSSYTPELIKSGLTKLGVSPRGIKPIYPTNLGIDTETIKNAVKGVDKKYEKFTFIYPGNNILPFKNIDQQIDMFDTLYQSGCQFQVNFHLIGYALTKYGEKLKDKSWANVKPSLNREEYFRECARSHMFLSSSKNETFGYAYWEASVAGCAGLFYDAPWLSIGKVPETFRYRNKGEGIVRLKWILDNFNENYDSYKEMYETYTSHIIENTLDEKVCDEQFLDTVEKVYYSLMPKAVREGWEKGRQE